MKTTTMMTNFWTNLFQPRRTYTKPNKSKKLEPVWPEWNETYQAYLTELIQTLETRIALQQQIKRLLELAFYLDKALNHA